MTEGAIAIGPQGRVLGEVVARELSVRGRVDGIVRTSDTGVTLIGWDDVARIRTYTNGFMMVLKRGTLPIPFRCLNAKEVDAMRGIAAARAAGELQLRGAV